MYKSLIMRQFLNLIGRYTGGGGDIDRYDGRGDVGGVVASGVVTGEVSAEEGRGQANLGATLPLLTEEGDF